MEDYYGLSGQLQSALARLHAIDWPPKATRYALLLSSEDEDAPEAVVRQYEKMLGYFGGEDAGVFCASGEMNRSEGFMGRLEAFGASL